MVLLDEAGLGRSATRLAHGRCLAPLVEHFWIRARPHLRDRWRIVPDTSGYLIFAAWNRPARVETRLFLVGARSRYADIDVTDRFLTVAARFQPGALAMLTGVPASELTDRSVPFDDVVGKSARELLDRMSTATLHNAQSHLADFLTRRLNCVDPDALHLGQLLTRSSRVDEVAAAIGVGQRSLYARSTEHVGLPPKHAQRIARLHRALWLAKEDCAWSSVATAAGYADQAHLTRDVHALVGEAPTNWARRGRFADSFKTGSGPNC